MGQILSLFPLGVSGGEELNFSVERYNTESEIPAVADENTIAAVTTTPIPGWLFSADEPASPLEGTLWIATGGNSVFAFNAINENTIMVYPTGAKQYISGTWKYIYVKIYQNGEWNKWLPVGSLYYKGDECEDVTGGWRAAYEGTNASIGKFIKNDDSITIEVTGNQAVFAATKNALNVTDAKTVKVHIAGSVNHDEEGRYTATVLLIKSGSSFNATNSDIYTVIPQGTTDAVIDLDVSEVSGNYYVCVYIRYKEETHSITFDEVILL